MWFALLSLASQFLPVLVDLLYLWIHDLKPKKEKGQSPNCLGGDKILDRDPIWYISPVSNSPSPWRNHHQHWSKAVQFPHFSSRTEQLINLAVKIQCSVQQHSKKPQRGRSSLWYVCRQQNSYPDYIKNSYTSIREIQLNRKMGKRIGT